MMFSIIGIQKANVSARKMRTLCFLHDHVSLSFKQRLKADKRPEKSIVMW